MIKEVIKRNGHTELWDSDKIINAVQKAFLDTNELNNEQSIEVAENVLSDIQWELENNDISPFVETIQDMVIDSLIEQGFKDTAIEYAVYRSAHKKNREEKERVEFNKKLKDIITSGSNSIVTKQDGNANVDSDRPMGKMLQFRSETSKNFALNHLLSPEYAEAHLSGDIHIHDLDFYPMRTLTCCQIDLEKLFKRRFNTGHRHIREPQSIQSYASLAAIALQANQNQQHRGQSINCFDYFLAPRVRKSFNKNLKYQILSIVEDLYNKETKMIVKDKLEDSKWIETSNLPLTQNIDEIPATKILTELCGYAPTIKQDVNTRVTQVDTITKLIQNAYIRAVDKTNEDTYQAMESFIHNLNTMHCLPASEKIWVKDYGTVRLASMKEIDDTFSKDRYEVLSISGKGVVSWKPILASQKKDNNREIAKITTETGQVVNVTTNHKVKTIDENLSIVDAFPKDLTHVISPKEYLNNLDAVIKDVLNKFFHRPDIKPLDIFEKDDDIKKFDNIFINKIRNIEIWNSRKEYVYDITVAENENFLTSDCIFVHNSRAGAQVPFTSINYGTDTSPEGRMVIKNVLLATIAGLGGGETPIFPIHVFKLKEGKNFNEDDPNFDLFKLACTTTGKRLFPNFSFIDAPFNKEFYIEGQPETEATYMRCRTRVLSNINGPAITSGRGNLSFTSINLPRLAIKAKIAHPDDEEERIKKFFDLLNEKMVLVKNQLLERMAFQGQASRKNFDFLFGEGVWIDSDKLGNTDTCENIIKHRSLSIGFIGLAETLTGLIGEHHGQSDAAQALGLKIVQFMRNLTDIWTAEHKLNYGIIGTPAESLSGRFVRIDKEKYGEIKGITDKEWYTNSSHIPVEYPISIFDKIQKEAPYHALENAGHISYVEVDRDLAKNPEAIMQIIKAEHDAGMGYASINHPVDRDPVCGYNGIIDNECPSCRRTEDNRIPFERIRRITGYLVGDTSHWVDSKKEEEKARVKHTNTLNEIETI